LLGLALAALAWALRDAPPLLSAALVLAAWIAATGALHLDGLADSADAWVGGLGDRERTLAIMKDPRCGPAGVVALVAVLLLKFAALASLPAGIPAYLLLLPPLLARAALTCAFVSTPYVRASGLGSALAGAARAPCLAALALALLLAAGCGFAGFAAVATATGLFVLWRRACIGRLGGFTGDTAGALAELSEAGVLVAVVLVAA